MKTRFVLIHTSHAGNVGAAARAMKVMGFDDLVLVAPRWPNVLRREETIQRASGALDVLAKARLVQTLDEALGGMTHLCATAMTPRDFGPPTQAPREHFSALISQLQNSEQYRQETPWLEADLALKTAPKAGFGLALLFGSERYGMANEDVYRCHVALSIPTNPDFGSLNLASAIQVIAYEWRLALAALGEGFTAVPAPSAAAPQWADAQQTAAMLAHWQEALVALGYLDPASPKKLLPRLNQLANRAQVTQEEIHILRGIARAALRAATLLPSTRHVDGGPAAPEQP
ncbi:MAG: RNA methyltransferase [Burkholderiaceae bacterium]